jgi:hypothetical protein
LFEQFGGGYAEFHGILSILAGKLLLTYLPGILVDQWYGRATCKDSKKANVGVQKWTCCEGSSRGQKRAF